MYLKIPSKDIPTHEIPTVSHFKYLGINIFPSIEKIVSVNYNRTLKSILDELTIYLSLYPEDSLLLKCIYYLELIFVVL